MSLFASLVTMLRTRRSGQGPASLHDPLRDPRLDRSLMQLWHEVLDELPGLISDRVTLLSLELRRASRAFAQLAVVCVLALLCGATAWFLAWGGLTAAMVVAGLHWGWAIAVAVAVNLLAALLMLRRAMALAPRLALPGTLRHMTLASRGEDVPGREPSAAGLGTPGAMAVPHTGAVS